MHQAFDPLAARLSTGVAGLDDILNGGFPEGHFFLLEGEPGTGKTTLGLQFLLDGAKRGEKGLYVTLSESKAEIEKVARSHQWSLDDLTIFEYTPTEQTLRPDEHYTVFHPSEIEFQATTEIILNEIERVHPTRIVFDSLSEMRLLAGDSLRYRRQILALKHYFANRNCTVLLLDDRTASPEDLQLQSIAHGVLVFEKVPREYGNTRRRFFVSKLRGSTYREGYHDYVITTGGIVTFPRLVATEHRMTPAEKNASSDNEGLDALWGGGISEGSSTLLMGPSGVGKSSIAMCYAVAAARRTERAALFLFEESLHIACRRAAKLGIDPTPHIEKGTLTIHQIDPAELSPGEFTQQVRDTVVQDGAKVVVIDSLNGYLNAMPDEHHLILQMRELLTFLNHHGVVTLLILAQSGFMGSSMTSPVDLSYLADNVLLFRYFEAAGRVRKAVSVVKKRTGQHEDTIREFQIGNGTITVGEPLTGFHGILTGVPRYVGEDSLLMGPQQKNKKKASTKKRIKETAEKD
jgi:circadian clock protein KaiC